MVGPGHVPIPAKQVSKITSGQFVDLADLLSANLRLAEQEPQTFLDGKLLVSKKCRQVEIQEILTWTEAFTIFQMVTCTTHSYRWPDLTKYKLLIIQTARQSPGRACLEYHLAFRKDAAANGLSDWSKMNSELYNFHLRSPAHLPNPGLLAPAPPPWSGGESSTEGTELPTASCVHSANSIVPVPLDEQRGLQCSAVSFCSSSVGTPSISVPVCLFSLLAPAPLVSQIIGPELPRPRHPLGSLLPQLFQFSACWGVYH